jgi:hypothetical protein
MRHIAHPICVFSSNISNMNLSPFIRRTVALLAISALLFTSGAVSAFVCPIQFAALSAQSVQADSAVPDCDDMDMAQSGLCKHHCKSGQEILNDVPLDLTPFVCASAITVVRFTPPQLVLANRLAPSYPALHHATSPPSAIRHCCFRI